MIAAEADFIERVEIVQGVLEQHYKTDVIKDDQGRIRGYDYTAAAKRIVVALDERGK